MHKFYVIGDYAEAGFSILNEEGGTMAECQRAIRWQGEGGGFTTPYHICKPSAQFGVFERVDNGALITVNRGPHTEKAHARHLSEIWPNA